MTKPMNRRNFLRAAATAAAGTLLTACAAATPSTTTGDGQPTAGVAPASGERVKLIYTTWGFGNWDNFIQMFNDSQTKIEATFEQVANDAYREKMLTSIAAGQSADVMEVSSYWMAEFMNKGLLISLDNFMESDPNLSKDKWLPNVFMDKLQMLDGVTYGLPSGDSPKVIWYNADLFKEAGLKTPTEYEAAGEWNWETFLQVAQQLTKGEGAEKQYGYQTWMGRADTDDIMRSYGGGWTDQEVTKVTAKEDASIAGLQMILDLYLKDKAAPLSQELQAMGGGQQMFLTRRLAMFMSGIWEIYGLKQSKDITFDVAPMPEGPAGRFMFNGANSLSIPKSCKYPNEAWELMRFLKSSGLEKMMVQGEAFMPFQKASVQTFLEKGYITSAQVFIDALEKGWAHPLPVNENGAKMDQVVGDALGLALSEGHDAAWVMDQVAPQLEGLVG